MEKKSDNLIRYEDLLKTIVNDLVSSCCNIDKDPPTSPGDLKNNNTWSKTIKDKSTGEDRGGVTFKINNSTFIKVSSNSVKTQLNDFLSSRGILDRKDALITAKAMLNFYNNVAIFISSRIRGFISKVESYNTTFFYYYDGSVDYGKYISEGSMIAPNHSSERDNPAVLFSKSEGNKFYDALLLAINKAQNEMNNTVQVSFACCCSSSSCSSCSCSSSSCSCSSCSSSSNYIVYMKLI